MRKRGYAKLPASNTRRWTIRHKAALLAAGTHNEVGLTVPMLPGASRRLAHQFDGLDLTHVHVRPAPILAGVLDDEFDAETIWFMFQRDVSDALGVELDEVTKDKWLIQELGAG